MPINDVRRQPKPLPFQAINSRHVSSLLKTTESEGKQQGVKLRSRFIQLRREGRDAQKIIDALEEFAHRRLQREEYASAEAHIRKSSATRTHCSGHDIKYSRCVNYCEAFFTASLNLDNLRPRY